MAKTASLFYELVHQEVFKELLFRPVCQRDCAELCFLYQPSPKGRAKMCHMTSCQVLKRFALHLSLHGGTDSYCCYRIVKKLLWVEWSKLVFLENAGQHTQALQRQSVN